MIGICAVCNCKSSLICSGCKVINYCSKDHQKVHWKEIHKKNCQPLFKLEENEKLGRYLVAAKKISKGEVIFREHPMVIGPKSVTIPICLGCHNYCQPDNYHECDGCGFPLCSPKCQISDYHLEECRLMMEAGFRAKINLQENKKDISYFPIVPLRCLLLKKFNLEKFKKIMNLQSHYNERINSSLFTVYKKNVSEFILERLKVKDFNENDILTISGILDINAFDIRTKFSQLRGLFNVASMLAHDCKPNTKHSFSSPEMTIVVSATSDIEVGTILSATYTQTFWNTLSRREHLKSAKNFECDCKRCADPTELGTFAGAIRCVRCASTNNYANEPYIISTDALNDEAPWACQNCNHKVSAKQIKIGNQNLKNELGLEETQTAKGLEMFLERYGVQSNGVLHARNYHVIQVKHALIQIYGNKTGFFYSDLSDEQLEKKIEYCHDLLDIVDKLEAEFSKIRGQILNELQAAMVIQAKRHFNEKKITKDMAQKILMDALIILKEAIEILRHDIDLEEFESRTISLKKELDD